MLFERSWDEEKETESYRFGSSLKGQNKSLRDKTRSDALFLSVAGAWNHRQLSQVHDWFARHLRGVQAPRITLRPFRIRESETSHASIQKMLRSADLGISDYKLSETPESTEVSTLQDSISRESDQTASRRRLMRIDMLHVITNGEIIPIPG